MLYPFTAVNRPDSIVAAAAGGCVLLRREALRDAGGIEAIHGALIDDVALARIVKSRPNGNGRIWLGHSECTASVRAYDKLSSIWQMVVRTADTQLDHSLLKLAGTVLGMALIYLLPPVAVLTWPLHQDVALGVPGLLGWLMMSFAFQPTLRLYRASIFWAPALRSPPCFIRHDDRFCAQVPSRHGRCLEGEGISRLGSNADHQNSSRVHDD